MSFAVPVTAIGIQFWTVLGGPQKPADTEAVTVTEPEAPISHCATPFWVMVAMVGSEINQVPV
jgi:hypothetical protein